jgi:hypothetical protein
LRVFQVFVLCILLPVLTVNLAKSSQSLTAWMVGCLDIFSFRFIVLSS